MMVGYVLHVRKAIGVAEFDFYCVVRGFRFFISLDITERIEIGLKFERWPIKF